MRLAERRCFSMFGDNVLWGSEQACLSYCSVRVAIQDIQRLMNEYGLTVEDLADQG